MIKYNNNNINDWRYGVDDLVKIYHNGAVVYYKINTPSTPTYNVCYAVVDNITQYQDRTYSDVFDKATSKWYKLNNLLQYEEYGVYGDGLDITTYDGKLTVEDNIEYKYSGGSWTNVGEVQYEGKTSGFVISDVDTTQQMNADDIVDGDYVVMTFSNSDSPTTPSRMVSYKYENGHNYLNNLSGHNNSDIISEDTIIDAAVWKLEESATAGTFYIKNVDANEYWGYQGKISSSSLYMVDDTDKVPIKIADTYSITSAHNKLALVEQRSGADTTYGGYGINNLFQRYYQFNWWNDSWKNTSELVYFHKVNGGNVNVYPVEYTEKSQPIDGLEFNTMEEANQYAFDNCVYGGMSASIDGSYYYFDVENGWVERPDITYYVAASSDLCSFDFNYYWGYGYAMEIEFYSSNNNADSIIWPNKTADIGTSTVTAPNEFAIYQKGFYYDFHSPLSTTGNNCSSSDYTSRVLETNVWSSYFDNRKLKLRLMTPGRVELYDENGNQLYSTGSSVDTSSYYDGLYEGGLGVRQNFYIKSINIYNQSNVLVNSLKFKYRGGSDQSQILYLYDSVLGVEYNNQFNSPLTYTIE